jgi:hypothetical protein
VRDVCDDLGFFLPTAASNTAIRPRLSAFSLETATRHLEDLDWALCAQNWQAHWVKNAMPLEYDGRVPALSADGLPMPNTQATTIVFGQLYVHAFSSIHPSLVSIISIEKLFEKIAQVWPVQEEFIAWPTKPMTDRDADNIQGAICEALEGLSRYSK